MPKVSFTANLKRFYPNLEPMMVKGSVLHEVLLEIEREHEGLRNYIVDDNGSLREHVNVFIGQHMIQDRQGLSDTLSADDEVYIMQAISGG